MSQPTGRKTIPEEEKETSQSDKLAQELRQLVAAVPALGDSLTKWIEARRDLLLFLLVEHARLFVVRQSFALIAGFFALVAWVFFSVFLWIFLNAMTGVPYAGPLALFALHGVIATAALAARKAYFF